MAYDDRRENARLRSERHRRRKGIPPRKPAQKPWLALGISRSTYYYRRQKKAREQAALAAAMAQRQAMFDRLEWMLAELRADLERVAGTHAEAEMGQVPSGKCLGSSRISATLTDIFSTPAESRVAATSDDPLHQSGKSKGAGSERDGETNRKQNCPTRSNYECPTKKIGRNFNMINGRMVPGAESNHRHCDFQSQVLILPTD
jgi:hypothetical protein